MIFSISERGLAFVAAREACSLTAYRDATMLAIGFGQNDPVLKEGNTITLDRAVELFVASSKTFAASLNKTFANTNLSQNHFDALYSLAYNIGGGAVARNAELVSAVNAFAADKSNPKLRDLAGYQIIRANFKDAPSNFSRRCREALLFTTGDYGDLSTLKLWPVGTLPRKDPPQSVPMPTFLKGA